MPPQGDEAGVCLEEAFSGLVVNEVRMDCSGGHTAVDNAPHFLRCSPFNGVLHFKGAKEVKGGKLKGAGSLGAFWGEIAHYMLAQLCSHLCAGDATVKYFLHQFSSLNNPGFLSRS